MIGVLAGLVIAIAPAAAQTRPSLTCAGAAGDRGGQLAAAETSPLLALLRRRLGEPSSCQVSESDAGREIRVGFAGGGRWTLLTNEILESAAQQATWPAGRPGLRRAAAVAVLREVERAAAPPDGCGIVWTQLDRQILTDTADAVVTGKTCNCRAHLRMQAGVATELGFSLAC